MFKPILSLIILSCLALMLTGQTVGVIVGPTAPVYFGAAGDPAVQGFFDATYFDPTYFDDGS